MLTNAHLADIYMILLLVAIMGTVFLVVFAWQKRAVLGAKELMTMNAIVVLWLVLTILDWNSLEPHWKLFWNQLGYFCVGFLPISWLSFSLVFTQKKWFRPIYMSTLAAIPIFVLILAFKGDLWTDIQYTRLTGSLFGPGYLYQEVKFTGWVYVSIGFAYTLILMGAINIIFSLYSHPEIYRRQAISPLIGSLAPLTLNAIYNFHLIPNWTMDLTPLGFAISSAALSWALFRDRLLNLIPLAHDILIDTMNDGLIVLDTNDNILDINPAARAITRYPNQTAINQSIFSILPAINIIPFNGEISVMVDQASHYYDVQTSPLYNRTNNLIEGYMLMMRDITARKEADDKLTRSEEIFRSMIEQSYDGVLLTDHEGKITIWNQSMERITGLKAEDMINKKIWELIDILRLANDLWEISPQEIKDYLQSILFDNTTEMLDQPIEIPLRVGGNLRYIQNVSFPINTSEGIILGSMTRDISTTKKNELEIKELYEGSLLLQKEAEAASEAKSQFLAVMSHELRTPMNAVIGMIQLLMDTNLSSKQLDYAQTIRSSGDTLLAIINDILDYSKIESGKMELENRPFNLHSIIEESFDLVSQQSDKKGLELMYGLAPSVPQVLIGDPTRLRQIITNLIGNAVKFTEKGEVVLKVRAAHNPNGQNSETSSCHTLYFSVTDTGIGIKKDKIDRLFKTFSQIDQSTTRVFGGTGLGLAISKRLIEAMGGKIDVVSQPDVGSEFCFSIRVSALIEPFDNLFEKVSALAKGKSAIILDENPTFSKLLTRYLNHLGISAESYNHIDEAVEALIGNPDFNFDLVLFDCVPLTKEKVSWLIKIQPFLNRASLILLTSQWNPLTDKSILKMADGVVNKPIKYNRLLNLLFHLFSGKPIALPVDTITDEIKIPLLGPQNPLRILLVEDNAVNQKVVSNSLERLGYQTAIVNNGQACLDILQNTDFDLIFMDVQMADMDGLETTRRIRKDWSYEKQPRIIALTAAALAGDRAKCIAAGMDNYISKPIRLPELVQVLTDTYPISRFDPEPFIIRNVQGLDDGKPEKEEELINLKTIEDLLRTLGKHKISLIQETIEIFISESGGYITNLKSALDEKNAKKMRHMTHTLKSTTASVGAIHLSNICKTMDVELRTILSSDNPMLPAGKFDQDVDRIANEFSRVVIELQKIKEQLPLMAEKNAEKQS